MQKQHLHGPWFCVRRWDNYYKLCLLIDSQHPLCAMSEVLLWCHRFQLSVDLPSELVDFQKKKISNFPNKPFYLSYSHPSNFQLLIALIQASIVSFGDGKSSFRELSTTYFTVCITDTCSHDSCTNVSRNCCFYNPTTLSVTCAILSCPRRWNFAPQCDTDYFWCEIKLGECFLSVCSTFTTFHTIHLGHEPFLTYSYTFPCVYVVLTHQLCT